jgi:hypothetical protein
MKERDLVRRIQIKFESRFPQLFFAVHFGAFPELPSLRQFGVWLLNRGVFRDVDAKRPNQNGILLVIDVNSKQCGITFGYSLLPYLDEDSTFLALSAAHPYFLEGDYLHGLDVVIHQIEIHLKKGWRRVRRNPESTLGALGQLPKRPIGEEAFKSEVGEGRS